MTESIVDTHKELVTEISKHNTLYYVTNKPEISDESFDKLMNELIVLESKFPHLKTENSPTQRVGSDLTNGFEKIQHRTFMGSLSNVFSNKELLDWYKQCQKELNTEENIQVVGEFKYDGLSLSLRYENGQLDKAVTRGDGTQGDDVTVNARTIKSIPLIIPIMGSVEVRGEVLMPKKAFIELNKEREKKGKELFANPRNAASGSLKQKESKEVAKRGLEFRAFDIIGTKNERHTQDIDTLRALGFLHPFSFLNTSLPTFFRGDVSDIFSSIDKLNNKDERDSLPFDIDGFVVKINDKKMQEKLGSTAKAPKWSVAYKFKAEQVSPRLLSVDFQVGRTGVITPVANLEPVEISGTIVKRASLHNEDQIRLHDIHVGDYVYLEKGGEIIPKIVGVNKVKREDVKLIVFPTRCPVCGGKVLKNREEAAHICINPTCKAKKLGLLEHFVGRKMMNINIGSEGVKKLYESGNIHTPDGFYHAGNNITFRDRYISLFGEKTANKIFKSIEESKKLPAHKFLYAVGIKDVGEQTAKDLLKHFKSIKKISEATHFDLQQVEGVGEKVSESIIDYFRNHFDFIQIWENTGVQMKIKEQYTENKSNALEGLKICLSGAFERSRDELKQLIEQNGGINQSGVTSKTDLFLAGDKVSVSKLNKVETLSIKTISESDLMNMISF